MDYTELRPNQEIHANGIIYDLKSLLALLLRVTDTRKTKGKQYSIEILLMLTLLAKLCGENTPSGIADWVAFRVDQLVEMRILPKRKAPYHMTYRRLMQFIVSPDELERLMSEYHQACLKKGTEIVFSMDGKTLKGTIPQGETRRSHLLSLYVPGQGLVFLQACVDRKENEIVVAPTILKQVSLEGVILIADAMHTQRETSKQILAAGGNYLWVVKGNQARTHWAIEKLNVVIGLCLRNGYQNLAKARRLFEAKPDLALNLICSA